MVILMHDAENVEFKFSRLRRHLKVQMTCFFIAEFERAAKIRKIAVYRFLRRLRSDLLNTKFGSQKSALM